MPQELVVDRLHQDYIHPLQLVVGQSFMGLRYSISLFFGPIVFESRKAKICVSFLSLPLVELDLASLLWSLTSYHRRHCKKLDQILIEPPSQRRKT